MCGFAGFWGGEWDQNNSVINHQLDKMADAMIHRGPDSSGIWINREDKIAFTHRRLAVLDLTESGAQPMSSKNQRYTIAYNGEIYNHLDLRVDLIAKGFKFRGHSDTETLLACFEEYGLEKTLTKLNGMFAFALYDAKEKSIFLARDRIGEKPLYYGWNDNTFFFGSELGSINAHDNFRGKIDRNSIASFLRYNYIPTPYSIYKKIYKLIPGTFLKIDINKPSHRNKNLPSPKTYWSLDEAISNKPNGFEVGDDAAMINSLESLLLDSISKQMISDVPLGVFLSGGIDSSTITAMMQSISGKPIDSFTIGFEEDEFNEAGYSKKIANYLGTNHHELYIAEKDTLDIIPKIQSIYSEPFADASQIPTILVSRLARKEVTVSLSGDGGDELFGGYNRYILSQKYQTMVNYAPLSLRKEISRRIINSNQNGILMKLASKVTPFSNPIEKLQKIGNVLTKDSCDEIYLNLTSMWNNPSKVVIDSAERDPSYSLDFANNQFDEYSKRMMYWDTLSYLPDDILTKVDRAAMSTSLETRIPFLDYRLIEFSWNLPNQFKIRNGKGKWILRELLYNYIPKKLIDRPKMGFAIPLDSWIRVPLNDWCHELLSPRKIKEQGFFDPIEIKKKHNEHLSGDKNWGNHLWSILMFQSWLEDK